MNTKTLALTLAEEHNEVDCCPLHWFIFNRFLAMLNHGHAAGHNDPAYLAAVN